MRIQIVEDDRALGEGIALALEEPGTEFIKNAEVRTAREDFQRQEPDVIILDLNLPDENGFTYLKWVRSRSCVPVLILTANDLELDEVKGFTLGADDYMTKPFSLAVLRARIRNLTRRLCTKLTTMSLIFTGWSFQGKEERFLLAETNRSFCGCW